MMEYPTIEKYIISEEPVVLLTPEQEQRMIEFMENLEMKRRIEQAQAMIDAKKIILI